MTPVGIVYPGDMGCALGRLLADDGVRVVTTTAGRSQRTVRLCRDAGLEVLDSLDEVMGAAQIVMSLVPPSAARAVAGECCAAAPRDASFVYVDVNSISPETACQIARTIDAAGHEFVDASIHGLAAQLEHHGTLYLSGPRAQTIADLTGRLLRTQVVGREPGAASALKMMLGGLSKGLVALFLEMGLMASQAGTLEAVLKEYEVYYPGVMTAIERLLPTYPRHAARRGDELREVGRTMRSYGLTPAMASAAEEVIGAVGRLRLDEARDAGDSSSWSVREVVEEVFRCGVLQRNDAGSRRIS